MKTSSSYLLLLNVLKIFILPYTETAADNFNVFSPLTFNFFNTNYMFVLTSLWSESIQIYNVFFLNGIASLSVYSAVCNKEQDVMWKARNLKRVRSSETCTCFCHVMFFQLLVLTKKMLNPTCSVQNKTYYDSSIWK